MSKRRRTSSIASRGQEDDSLDSIEASTSTGASTRKRFKKQQDPVELCQQLYDIIRNHKKEDGSLLCDAFIRVPKRRQEPSYYDVVSNPIDLLKVQQKLKTEEYEDIEEMQNDIELIVNNTKAFYKKNSQEYKDAIELWDLFLTNKNKLLNVKEEEPEKTRTTPRFNSRSSKKANSEVKVEQPPTPPPPTPQQNEDSADNSVNLDDEMNQYEELFTTVMTAVDAENKPLHTAFQLLPSKKRYPEYYDVIETPIDLKMIAIKIQNNEYNNLNEMEKDLLLMTKNACLFNEPGSQIYRNAKTLKRIIQTRKIEVEHAHKANAGKTSERIRNKRLRGTTSLSAVTAALKDEDSEPEEPEEPTEEEKTGDPVDLENPQWKLFETVKSVTSNTGAPLSDPFWRLPSKRFYPDYYREIKNPVSLTQIRRKLVNRAYGTVSEVAGDLTIMFENAKKYNIPTSKLYKDAIKLQKVMQTKVQELLDIDQVTQRVTNKNRKDSEPEVELEEKPPVRKKPGPKPKNPQSAGNTPTSRTKSAKDGVPLKKRLHALAKYLLDYTDTKNEINSEEKVRKKPGPKPKNPQSSGNTPPSRGKPPKDSLSLKKRLHTIAKSLLDYTCEDGRKPMLGFMEKPSKKLYPDYYEVISEPIDFLEIESKIRAEQYSCENDLVRDFKLMFANCRQYNEENSPIYEDATTLEKYLLDKVAQLQLSPEKKERPAVPKIFNARNILGIKVKRRPRVVDGENRSMGTPKPRRQISPTERMLRTLYDTIRDYREPKANRQLALIFMKLPSKIDYPDYYEVIKHPIDMEKISQKLRTGCYETLDALVSDFHLMFDNACKYNEPDSQIYKDALVLQRVCLQTKLQLKEDNDTVPDVPAAIQDILLNLFTNVYNHQDSDERCYSDSMADLPEHDEVDGKKVRALSLDLIKRRLDRGLYRRLDTFQEDIFACLDRARRISRTDSQVFEDSIELQSFFIKQRDELCKNGELLQSPALAYTMENLTAAVESLRQSKLLQESLEEETETRSSDDSIIKDGANVNMNMSVGDSMTCNQQTFKVGEFVYLEPKEKACEPHILKIERLWTNNGQQMLYGNYYLRPAETYHLTTRKFLEKEVFKSDTHIAVPLEEVKERCCVVNVKQYFTMKPEGYDEKDVYVCESRYSTRCRSFKKIKIYPENPTLKLVPRDVPLEPKRIVSVFRERVEKHKDELAELQEQEKLMEKEKPNVVAYRNTGEDSSNTYYEQYNTVCSGVVKTGDFVYVAAEGGKQMIAQIDSIWDTKDGKCYFRGPWFVTPVDIPHSPGKLFYKQEVFLSSLEDTNPLVGIVGKCSVLEYNDYISCRPTEIPETDVFICSSMYDELNRQIRKLPIEGLKKYTHSSEVTEDEIYYFPKIINPPRVVRDRSSNSTLDVSKGAMNSSIMDVDASPQLTKMTDMDMLMEDSMDGGPPSVGSGDMTPMTPTPGTTSTPTPATSKRKTNKNKVVTGYILYSREVRKQIVQNNPESNFGEISRIVGNEWRSLPTTEKQSWEEKANKLNEETKAMLLAEESNSCASPIPGEQIYECLWDNCDYQFEELSDVVEHCLKDKESQGHIQAYFQANPDLEFHCHWKNCIRNNKKNLQPFPNMARLVRHVRDMHINKGNGRLIQPADKSKNFKPSSKPTAVSRPTPTATPNPTTPASSNAVAPPVQKQEPMFISVPPRPQRVFHSEAYIKYIEGLQSDNKYITAWDKNLQATPENTPAPDPEKLHNVAAWLGKKADQQDNVLAALWNLRNQLLKDTLGLPKTL